MVKHYKKQKALGLCTNCTEPAEAFGRPHCERCRLQQLARRRRLHPPLTKEEKRARARAWYQQRKQYGYCSACEQPSLPDNTLCREHYDEMRAQMEVRRVARLAAGLCGLCNQPAVSGRKTCVRHTPKKRPITRSTCLVCSAVAVFTSPYCAAHLPSPTVRDWSKRLGIPSHVLAARKKGSCEICGRKNNNGRALDIDHCHATNVFRGFLCNRCNTGLGNFRDDPAVMRAAIRYLMRQRVPIP